MRADLAELLRCPRSGGRLDVVAFEIDGDEIDAGLLRGPAGDYPIVGGIPVLLSDVDESVVARVRAGDHGTATALAVARGIPLSRLDPILPGLLALRPARPVARWLARLRDRSIAQRVQRALAAPAGEPEALLQLAFVENRSPNPEGYRYFRFRLGLPRHLVALGAVAGCEPPLRPVVEIGSGAGHMTWQLRILLDPRPVIAIERELHLLWVARHHIAPGADLVCGDATSLPLADGSCSLGVAVDVLSFVSAKAAAVRELRRVVGPDGGLVLTSLINSDARHEFAGDPLPAGAWTSLVDGVEHVAVADSTVLGRYLERQAPPSVSDSPEQLASEQTLTLLAEPAALTGLDRSFTEWPHALGRLGPHPVLAPASSPGAPERCWRAQLPSGGFARDNDSLRRYLPDDLCLSSHDIEAARQGVRTAALHQAIDRVAVLGYPERWPADPWSSPPTGA